MLCHSQQQTRAGRFHCALPRVILYPEEETGNEWEIAQRTVYQNRVKHFILSQAERAFAGTAGRSGGYQQAMAGAGGSARPGIAAFH